ncbi:vesicular integral-membrane protein VIP36-like [Littorina saxatilis]|uniref:L-type lectin-like domain-containing protein n=1 Tax=Littorina saxatilis TaxID=31220 RepID=A0AAN9BQ11_9CAEN
MASHVRNLSAVPMFLCVFLCVLAEWNTKDFQRREHTLVKPYQGSGMSVPQWDFLGSTMVTNSYIRLTSDHQSRQGAIWNNVRCHVQNWELHVQFKVHGAGKNLFGDGMAIWYTQERMQLGPVFGSRDLFTGLGIFLDTYSNHNGPHNHQHPFISAMINNGTLHYDHDSDGTHTSVAGCEAQFRNKDYDTYLAIRYEDNTLKVSVDVDNKNGWRECFVVHGVKLPVGYFLGASAATGELADNHDVISVKFYELESEKKNPPYTGLPEATVMEAPRDRVEDKRGSLSSYSGWKLFMIIILIIIALAVVGVVGFIVFQKQQENSRKRFY